MQGFHVIGHIDIAARHHAHDIAAQPRVSDRSSHSSGTRAFGHHPDVAGQPAHGLHHLGQLDHANAVNQRANHRPDSGNHTGPANAANERSVVRHLHHLARLQRTRGRRGMRAFHRQYAHAGLERLDRAGHAYGQATAAIRGQHYIDIGQIFQDLQANAAVAGKHGRVGHGVDQ